MVTAASGSGALDLLYDDVLKVTRPPNEGVQDDQTDGK